MPRTISFGAAELRAAIRVLEAATSDEPMPKLSARERRALIALVYRVNLGR